MLSIATQTLRSLYGPLLTTVVRAWRLLIAFWPALSAWMLVGYLGRYVVVEIAGWVGFHNSLAGLALMPFAVLARLVALVAMLLIVRDGMPHLTSVAPVPAASDERRREFVESVLAGILPFFAFYLAWGFLRNDMAAYYGRVFEVSLNNLPFDPTGTEQAATGDVTLTWFTATVIAITFVLRRVVQRFGSKKSRIVPVVAVYLEALWVFLSALVLSDVLARLTGWMFSRQGIAWFDSGRRWISEQATALDWLLQFGGWLLGEVSGLALYPLAWLTIAGVIYGQTISPPSSPTRRLVDRLVADRRLGHVRQRVTGVPGWFRRRAREVWDDLMIRIRPIGEAIRLMWHVGPVMIAGFVLVYQIYVWLESQLNVVIPRLFGPHPLTFWETYSPAIGLIAPVVAAPLGIAIIGATFDSVLARSQRSRQVSADAPAVESTSSTPNIIDLVESRSGETSAENPGS